MTEIPSVISCFITVISVNVVRSIYLKTVRPHIVRNFGNAKTNNPTKKVNIKLRVITEMA